MDAAPGKKAILKQNPLMQPLLNGLVILANSVPNVQKFHMQSEEKTSVDVSFSEESTFELFAQRIWSVKMFSAGIPAEAVLEIMSELLQHCEKRASRLFLCQAGRK